MNKKRIIGKLQQALIKKGIRYKINTSQFFSEEQQRMITCYSVREKQSYTKPNGEITMKDVELLKTCSQIELLKWLTEQWQKVK